MLALVGALAGGAVAAGVTIYLTPKYTRAGYQPVQPVPFSHNIHAGQLGLDCRYCHNGVEKSWFANLPGASTCMNCHSLVLKDDPRLAIVRNSASNNVPISWVQVHKTPDYVYFNHSVHVTRGISCVECHGRIDQMDVVTQKQPLSMGWCLECHRAPESHLRPKDQVTNMNWKPSETSPEALLAVGKTLAKTYDLHDTAYMTSCYTCHR